MRITKKALEYFRYGGSAINFDLNSGYHDLENCPHRRQYLGLAWTSLAGKERFPMFNVLLFRLSTASYISTQLLRPLVKQWRSRCFHSEIYLLPKQVDCFFGDARKSCR